MENNIIIMYLCIFVNINKQEVQDSFSLVCKQPLGLVWIQMWQHQFDRWYLSLGYMSTA